MNKEKKTIVQVQLYFVYNCSTCKMRVIQKIQHFKF